MSEPVHFRAEPHAYGKRNPDGGVSHLDAVRQIGHHNRTTAAPEAVGSRTYADLERWCSHLAARCEHTGLLEQLTHHAGYWCRMCGALVSAKEMKR